MKKLKKYALHIVFVLLVLLYFFPQYAKRTLLSPFISQKYDAVLEISAQDYFGDVANTPFVFERNSKQYTLVPQTRYAVTGRVGIVERYDTLWGKFYRGHSQKDYINLVPQDVFLVIGDMAKDEIFKKFVFEHEERLGRVLCKGVKYRKSFMPSAMSRQEAKENWEKYQECNRFIKQNELNNYHPIPANERINQALLMLTKGDVVYLEGLLVDVPQMRLKTGRRKNQYHENMIAGGVNPGMCFILYTTRVILNGRIYE